MKPKEQIFQEILEDKEKLEKYLKKEIARRYFESQDKRKEIVEFMKDINKCYIIDIKLTTQKLADLNAYLVVVNEQYKNQPTDELKDVIEQTKDEIIMVEEDLDELV